MRRSELLVIHHKSKLPISSQCIMLSSDRDVVNELHTSAANAEVSVSSCGQAVDETAECGSQVTYTSSLDKEEESLPTGCYLANKLKLWQKNGTVNMNQKLLIIGGIILFTVYLAIVTFAHLFIYLVSLSKIFPKDDGHTFM